VLLPDKHLRLSESVLGLAGLVLSHVAKPTPFDSVWKQIEAQLDTREWPAVHGVENFVLALCFLYAIGAIDVSPAGELFRCV
jgi:hypothetical protein